MLEILLLSASAVLISLSTLYSPLFWVAVVVFAFALPGFLAMRGGAPYLPTSSHLTGIMIDLAGMTTGQTVFDLGCGDGRIVLAAARRGARAIGYEVSLPTFLLAKLRCASTKGADIRYGDFWRQDYRNADVIFCYLLPESMVKFHAVIWPTLKSGCRVVSHSFPLKEETCRVKKEGVFVYDKE